MNEEDIASPTVVLESIFITVAIEAYEDREVTTVDIPNTFIQTDNKGEKVVMKVSGGLARILTSIAPNLYKHYLMLEKGTPTLYLVVLKAIYGLLQSALLFYRKLRGDVEMKGFKINPYDPCVANKMIKGYQMTLTWHVDDVKISHKLESEVNNCINWLKKKYGKLNKIKAH